MKRPKDILWTTLRHMKLQPQKPLQQNGGMPAIAADLKPSASQLLWIIGIYGFMAARFLLVRLTPE